MNPTQWPVGWPKTWPMRILAGIWSCPGGILSILATLALWPVARWRHMGGLEFESQGPLGRWFANRGWAAFTPVWCRWYWVSPDLPLRRHEGRHVAQALTWGLLYSILMLGYVAFGYEDSPTEVDARAHEEGP